MNETSARPRALVVYESMFGNTEQVASAVARGLQLEGVDTGLAEVSSAPAELAAGLDLLVVGAPTHGFSLSRPSTRADAVRQGAPQQRAEVGLREWLEAVPFDHRRPPEVVTFGTLVTKVRWIPKSSATSAAHVARRHGLPSTRRPMGFLVDDVKGPLLEGELERAVAWGRELGAVLVDRLAASSVNG